MNTEVRAPRGDPMKGHRVRYQTDSTSPHSVVEDDCCQTLRSTKKERLYIFK